ncbi:hypothetical protein [Streptomyces sp. NPDC059970]|uniref:hypothetical protein n=1 Tax=Streptomyces sp. NPDC059970 TaxID=3347019 RepID=UPI0036995224
MRLQASTPSSSAEDGRSHQSTVRGAPRTQQWVQDSLTRTGQERFTGAHFHTGPELEAEMREAGFTDTRVDGAEGPALTLLKATEQHTGESLTGSRMFTSAPAAARMAEPYPGLLAAGSHLLAVGRI